MKWIVYGLIFLFAITALMPVANAQLDPTAPWDKPQVLQSSPISLPKSAILLPEPQSIVCGGVGCKGVINDQSVSIGDSVEGFRVVSIEPTHLTLKKGGRQWRLSVRNQPQGMKIG